MARTIKKDWYNDMLSNNGIIVSGHELFSNFLGLTKEFFCTLRFIHQNGFLKILLLIEAPSTDDFQQNGINSDALGKLIAVFNDDLLIVIFDEKDFLFSGDLGTSFTKMNSDELENQFTKMRGEITQNKGTFKSINKTENDSFQSWTRNHLSKYCTINDIDAIQLSGTKTIYELKRVEESIETWKPYLDDYSNYRSFYFIAERYKIMKRVVAYNENNLEHVAVHVGLTLDPMRNFISGGFLILRPVDSFADKLPIPYRSTNRRQ